MIFVIVTLRPALGWGVTRVDTLLDINLRGVTIGLRYPFPDFISCFFDLTGLRFAQTMPMVWRVLVMLDQIKSRHIPVFCPTATAISYFFQLPKTPLILKATKNEDEWKRKFFLSKEIPSTRLAAPSAESEQRIKDIYQLPESERTFSLSFASSNQKSSSDMSAPAKIPEVFDLEELDSYSGPVQVKK
ncbi:hypothetical protein Hanom_Chr08g00728881 [Helianthus anomalus]